MEDPTYNFTDTSVIINNPAGYEDGATKINPPARCLAKTTTMITPKNNLISTPKCLSNTTTTPNSQSNPTEIQIGSNDCIPSIVEFLTNCVQQGVIQLNVEELVKDVQFTVSIPKRNINFCNLAKSVNVKDDQCSQAIDWHNISDVNEESVFENEEVDKPNKKTNATTTTVECSNETSQKIQNEKEAVHQVIFTDGMTKFMLEKYGQLMNFIGPMKKFKRKLDMWKQIAKDMEEELGVKCTHTQIENCYKTVSKRKKVIVNNNKSTGAARMDDEYENEWKQITNKDDSIIPEVMRSTKVVVINKKDITESKPKKMKTDSSQLMLLKFPKEKEESKERRHQEKMELIRSILNK